MLVSDHMQFYKIDPLHKNFNSTADMILSLYINIILKINIIKTVRIKWELLEKGYGWMSNFSEILINVQLFLDN